MIRRYFCRLISPLKIKCEKLYIFNFAGAETLLLPLLLNLWVATYGTNEFPRK